MARDLEIAVIDGTRGVGNGLLLPAGPLREPVQRLDSVDWVIANGELSNLVEDETVMQLVADKLFNLGSGLEIDMLDFATDHPRVHAVCGIGNPQRFITTLRDLGLSPELHAYSDHYEFEGPEVQFYDSMPVVCTEKDAAKLKHLEIELDHVFYLQVSVELPPSAPMRLQQLLEERAIAPRSDAPDDGDADVL
jgi:tetraacyldisaccharide 4'-kinase